MNKKREMITMKKVEPHLTMSPKLGKEDLDPEVVNRMIILGPKANVSENQLANELHLLNLPLTIKETCYGAMVSGKEEDVLKAIEEIRKLDSPNIFTKDRGFAPGDPRRCRGHRLGPREGFHQLEKEFEILEYVGDSLKNPREVKVVKPKPLDFDEFKEIVKNTD